MFAFKVQEVHYFIPEALVWSSLAPVWGECSVGCPGEATPIPWRDAGDGPCTEGEFGQFL